MNKKLEIIYLIWKKYINTKNDYDALINMAVIHYQFEKIHPFYDENGKTGLVIGIHLHLGMKYLDEDKYVDPELYDYKEQNTFLHKR